MGSCLSGSWVCTAITVIVFSMLTTLQRRWREGCSERDSARLECTQCCIRSRSRQPLRTTPNRCSSREVHVCLRTSGWPPAQCSTAEYVACAGQAHPSLHATRYCGLTRAEDFAQWLVNRVVYNLCYADSSQTSNPTIYWSRGTSTPTAKRFS